MTVLQSFFKKSAAEKRSDATYRQLKTGKCLLIAEDLQRFDGYLTKYTR